MNKWWIAKRIAHVAVYRCRRIYDHWQSTPTIYWENLIRSIWHPTLPPQQCYNWLVPISTLTYQWCQISPPFIGIPVHNLLLYPSPPSATTNLPSTEERSLESHPSGHTPIKSPFPRQGVLSRLKPPDLSIANLVWCGIVRTTDESVRTVR